MHEGTSRVPGTAYSKCDRSRLTGRSASKPPEGRRAADRAAAPAGTRGTTWTSCPSADGWRTGGAGARCRSRSSPTGWASRRAGSTRSSGASAGSTSSPCVYEIADVLQLDVQLLLGKDPERRAGRASTASTRSRSRRSGPRWSATTRSARSSTPPPEPAAAAGDAQGGQPRLADLPARRSTACSPARCRGCCARPRPPTPPTPATEQGRQAAHLLGAGLPDRLVGAAQARRARPGLARRRPLHRGLPARRRPAARRHRHLPGRQRAARARPGPARAGAQRQHRQPARARRRRTTRPASACPSTACCCCRARWPRPGIGDSATVRDLLAGAEEAAKQLGGDQNHYWTCFGPTNVELHRAAAAVELGEGPARSETHETHRPAGFDALLPERRAHHFLDLARGLAQIGDIARAGEMLLEGDRLAPSEIRCRPIAHEVLSDVLRRTRGTPPPPVAELAEHMGVGREPPVTGTTPWPGAGALRGRVRFARRPAMSARWCELAQCDGWDVCVVTTPDGRKFIDVPALAAQTGHPVRSQLQEPGDPDVLPDADAMIVAPPPSTRSTSGPPGSPTPSPSGCSSRGTARACRSSRCRSPTPRWPATRPSWSHRAAARLGDHRPLRRRRQPCTRRAPARRRAGRLPLAAGARGTRRALG